MAGKIALDLKQFKHIKSDKNTTTLKHADGHMLTIAHKALSPDSQRQLDALSGTANNYETTPDKQEAKTKFDDGGKVPAPAQQDPAPPKDTSEKPVKNQWEGVGGFSGALNNAKKELGLKDGGRVMCAEGLDSTDANTNKVPVPGNGPNDANDAQRKLKDAAEGAKKAEEKGGIPKGSPLSTGDWSHVFDAQGGKVRKMYADPTQTVFQDDNAPVTGSPTEKLFNPNDPGAKGPIEPDPQESIAHFLGHGIAAGMNALGYGVNKLGQGVQKTAEFGKNVAKEAEKSSPVIQGIENQLKEEPAVQPQMNASQVQQQDQQPQDVPQDPMPQQAPIPKSNIPSPEGLLSKAYSLGNQGATDTAGAMKALGDEEARVQAKQHEADVDAIANYRQTVDSLNMERQAHIKDMQNGYIDPNKYWTGYTAPNGDQVPGHSKVASAIGMILAGFNPTNKPNAAIDLLKYNMDKSLEAQGKNLDSQHNLLRANLQQFGNIKDATDATRVMMSDAMSHQLGMTASQAKGPLAQAAAKQAQSQLAASILPTAMQLQMRQTLQRISNGGQSAAGTTGAVLNQLDAVNPEASKAYRSRFYSPFDVPGGKSLADRELPPAVIDQLNSHAKFDEAGKQLANIVQQNRGNLKVLLDPTNPTSKIARQQAMILQSLFREGTLGTVYREGEQPLLDKAIKSDPLSLVSYFTELPKLQGLLDSNRRFRDVTAAGYGLRPPPDRHSMKSQAPNIQTKDGVKYIQQGNYMVPVK